MDGAAQDGGTMTAGELKERILKALGDADVEAVDARGDGRHWAVHVVAEVFRGKGTIERHRMVMDALRDAFGERLHAVEIRALAPGEA